MVFPRSAIRGGAAQSKVMSGFCSITRSRGGPALLGLHMQLRAQLGVAAGWGCGCQPGGWRRSNSCGCGSQGWMGPSAAPLIAATAHPVLACGCVLRSPGEGERREEESDYPSSASGLMLLGTARRRQASSGCRSLSFLCKLGILPCRWVGGSGRWSLAEGQRGEAWWERCCAAETLAWRGRMGKGFSLTCCTVTVCPGLRLPQPSSSSPGFYYWFPDFM